MNYVPRGTFSNFVYRNILLNFLRSLKNLKIQLVIVSSQYQVLNLGYFTLSRSAIATLLNIISIAQVIYVYGIKVIFDKLVVWFTRRYDFTPSFLSDDLHMSPTV